MFLYSVNLSLLSHYILIYYLSLCIKHMHLSCSLLCLQLQEHCSSHSRYSINTCEINELINRWDSLGNFQFSWTGTFEIFSQPSFLLSLLWTHHNLKGLFHFWNGHQFHPFHWLPHLCLRPSFAKPLSSFLNHSLPCSSPPCTLLPELSFWNMALFLEISHPEEWAHYGGLTNISFTNHQMNLTQ